MHQLVPQETFPIVYLLSDPSDAATYYVRAVLRNSVSGAVIQVNALNYVNLTNLGNRRFAASIQAPNDPSGLGTYIDVTVSVYTDSGYTTKSDVYKEQNTPYLVQQRWSSTYGSGPGLTYPPQEKIDYKKLSEVVLEAFGSLPTTELPDFDLSGVYAQGDSIRSLLEALGARETPKIDLESHTKQILTAIMAAVQSIEIPSLDLTPVLDAVSAIKIPEGKNYDGHFEKVRDEIQNLLPKVEQYNKYAKFSKTIDGLLKEYGASAPEKPATREEVEYDPRVKALFKR